MSTTGDQFEHLLSLAEENEILHQKEREAIMLMTSLILNKRRVLDILINSTIEIQQDEKALLLDALFDNNPYRKEKAYTILFRQLGIHQCLVADVLSIAPRTIRKRHRCYKEFGLAHLLNKNRKFQRKRDNTELKELLFGVLHSPPSDYGINRTTWTIPLLRESILNSERILIDKNTISQIIKKEGYRFLKAREVLTSNDPEYKEKLKKITQILRRLGPNDRFVDISCDEFRAHNHVRNDFQVEIGDKIRAKLCSNPTTGFKWEYEMSNETMLKEEDYDFEEPKGDVPGAAGIEVWTFEAVEKGTTEVHMAYSQRWEGGLKEEWTYTITVTVE